MHVKVREFLVEEVGYRRSFTISGERPTYEGVQLASDIEGEITISRLDDGLLVSGQVHTEVHLICDRCLRSFTRPVRFTFDRMYRDNPTDDDLPIEHDSIDLAPLIEQELIVVLPIKQLCKPDCPGIPVKADDLPTEPSLRVGDRARITKG